MEQGNSEVRISFVKCVVHPNLSKISNISIWAAIVVDMTPLQHRHYLRQAGCDRVPSPCFVLWYNHLRPCFECSRTPELNSWMNSVMGKSVGSTKETISELRVVAVIYKNHYVLCTVKCRLSDRQSSRYIIPVLLEHSYEQESKMWLTSDVVR